PFRLFDNALENRKRGLHTRAVIIDELLNILIQAEQDDYELVWPGLTHRAWLTKRLETVASCIETHFPRHFLTGTPEMDRWTGRSASEMANGVREMVKWVVVPSAHTCEDFKARVNKYFAAALASEWGRFDRVSAENLFQRKGMMDRVASLVSAVLTAAVPILLLLLLSRLDVVAEPLLTYLTVGAYIWAALSLLSQLDPQYATKMAALKDLTKTFPLGKKDGGEG
ncbi:MAG: hypothetical protein DMF68_16330, partial [Acidobacteria bacterium]